MRLFHKPVPPVSHAKSRDHRCLLPLAGGSISYFYNTAALASLDVKFHAVFQLSQSSGFGLRSHLNVVMQCLVYYY